MKSNKGITLIALVITIIVLLILAGVSIAMLTGDNGILKQAEKADDNTEVAEIVERVNMELNAQYAAVLAGKTAFTTGASTAGTDEKALKDNLSAISSKLTITVDTDEITIEVNDATLAAKMDPSTATVSTSKTFTALKVK